MEYTGGDLMNCQDICPHKKLCIKFFNCHGYETDSKRPHAECPNAWKIDDLLMDAEDIRREQEREREREFEEYDDPFNGIHNPTVYSSRAEIKAIESESGLD